LVVRSPGNPGNVVRPDLRPGPFPFPFPYPNPYPVTFTTTYRNGRDGTYPVRSGRGRGRERSFRVSGRPVRTTTFPFPFPNPFTGFSPFREGELRYVTPGSPVNLTYVPVPGYGNSFPSLVVGGRVVVVVPTTFRTKNPGPPGVPGEGVTGSRFPFFRLVTVLRSRLNVRNVVGNG
jgi:hypothetical protein